MQEIVKILIGVVVLIFGILIGNLLAKNTKSELKKNQKWFKLIIIISLIGGFTGLIIGKDAILFGFFLIAVVTSRSLRR